MDLGGILEHAIQMAVSPFYWIDKVMEEVVENVGRMLNKEASIGQNTREAGEESTIEGLKKKYPCWMKSSPEVELVKSSEKAEDTVSLFEDKNTRV